MSYTDKNGILANKLSLVQYREQKANAVSNDEIYTITDIDEYVYTYKESLDSSNPIILRNLDTGVYKIYGYFRYYSSQSGISAVDPFAFVVIEKGSSYSYATVIASNSYKQYKITDSSYEDLEDSIPSNNVLTAKLGANLSEVVNSTYTKLELELLNKSGNKLSISNGGIKIGSGISKVLVSGNVKFVCGVTGNKHVRIYKNSTTIGWNSKKATVSNEEFGITINPILIDVVEGDVLYLYYYAQTGDGISSGYNTTILTVNGVR